MALFMYVNFFLTKSIKFFQKKIHFHQKQKCILQEIEAYEG